MLAICNRNLEKNFNISEIIKNFPNCCCGGGVVEDTGIRTVTGPSSSIIGPTS